MRIASKGLPRFGGGRIGQGGNREGGDSVQDHRGVAGTVVVASREAIPRFLHEERVGAEGWGAGWEAEQLRVVEVQLQEIADEVDIVDAKTEILAVPNRRIRQHQLLQANERSGAAVSIRAAGSGELGLARVEERWRETRDGRGKRERAVIVERCSRQTWPGGDRAPVSGDGDAHRPGLGGRKRKHKQRHKKSKVRTGKTQPSHENLLL